METRVARSDRRAYVAPCGDCSHRCAKVAVIEVSRRPSEVSGLATEWIGAARGLTFCKRRAGLIAICTTRGPSAGPSTTAAASSCWRSHRACWS